MTSIYKSPAGKQAILAVYDARLSRWPVPYETFNVPTRHGETFIVASGKTSSPPLVLLHGSASNAASWIKDIPEYSQHWRVYAVDLLGEAGKSAGNRLQFTNQTMVEWMEDWLHYLKIERTALLGISMGAWIVTKFAVCHPEQVSSLILLAPAGIAQAKRSFVLRAILSIVLRRWNRNLSNRLNYGSQPMDEENVRCMEVISDHFRPRFETLPVFTAEELRRLTMPLLLVGGARDEIFPTIKTAERLKKLAPQVCIRVLPEAGHVLYHTAPLVMPFLSLQLSRD